MNTYRVSSICLVWDCGRELSWFLYPQSLTARGKIAQTFELLLWVAQTLPTFLRASLRVLILLLTFTNLLMFFSIFLQEKTQFPMFFYHSQKYPSVCGPRLFRYMHTGMNPLLGAMSQLLWIYKIKGRVINYACVLMGSIFSANHASGELLLPDYRHPLIHGHREVEMGAA